MQRFSVRIAAAACAAAAMLAGAAEAQTLRARLNSDIRSTDPGTNRDGPTDGVVQHMVEGLVAFREDTSVGPLLAERYDVSDDGKTYTFTLRPGVRFHNGAPLTADDVVWSWQRYLDAATQWRCRPEFAGGLVMVALGLLLFFGRFYVLRIYVNRALERLGLEPVF